MSAHSGMTLRDHFFSFAFLFTIKSTETNLVLAVSLLILSTLSHQYFADLCNFCNAYIAKAISSMLDSPS